jgi:hypothetical protein
MLDPNRQKKNKNHLKPISGQASARNPSGHRAIRRLQGRKGSERNDSETSIGMDITHYSEYEGKDRERQNETKESGLS